MKDRTPATFYYTTRKAQMGRDSANRGTPSGHAGDVANDLDKASFVEDLHRALGHLYDPTVLLHSSLVQSFGLDRRRDIVAALRSILIDGIEHLKPDKNVPSDSQAWRVYRVLRYRYAEQLTQREVAHDLRLSVRQLRRQEKAGLRVLADSLWRRYDLHLQAPTPATSQAGREISPTDTSMPSRQRELAWLRESLPSEPTDLRDTVEAALMTVGPLLRRARVRVDCKLSENLPRLAVQVVAMQQALVNVLTAAVGSVPGGTIYIQAESDRWDVHLEIRPTRRDDTALAQAGDQAEALRMAQQLITLFGGTMQVQLGDVLGRPFVVQIFVPAAGQIPVMVIDDNADALHLFKRYLLGTRYRFVGVSDPQRAVETAINSSCRAIVLDVMLPGVGGWELLGRLRAHPQTRGLPTIVCTILPQEQLALALGAAAFIRKPVCRLDLLSVLDRETEAGLRESR